MLEAYIKFINKSLAKYNNSEIDINGFVNEIYDLILPLIPNLQNVDRYDVRQDICSQLLTNKDLEFTDAEKLIHYIRAAAGNINKAEFKRLMKNSSLDDENIELNISNSDNGNDNLLTKPKLKNSLGKEEGTVTKQKTVAELIKEKGDYSIQELAGLLGVFRNSIYAMIKQNYMSMDTRFKLKAVKPFDSLATYDKIKRLIYEIFGSLEPEVFKKLPVSRQYFYKRAKTGMNYTKSLEIIKALENFECNMEAKIKLNKLIKELS